MGEAVGWSKGLRHYRHDSRVLADASAPGYPGTVHDGNTLGIAQPDPNCQSILNAMDNFQRALGGILKGLINEICLAWIHDIINICTHPGLYVVDTEIGHGVGTAD